MANDDHNHDTTPGSRPAARSRRSALAMRDGRFERDGVSQLVLAGEIHYFRLPRTDWESRLELARQAGLDTVATYLPWLWHELPDGSLDLTGATVPERDLGAFLGLCADFGFDVIARPGPFCMAELLGEGIPASVRRDDPTLHPVGWDARPAPTRDLDYGAPGFRRAATRWLDAVLPLLAAAQPEHGGPVSAVQLDNEIGMLAWVTNTPQLTDRAVAKFVDWLIAREGSDRATELIGVELDAEVATLAAAVRAGGRDALGFHHALGHFARAELADYQAWLITTARDHGLTVPLLINVHGTGGGRGTTFPIGVSQLAQGFRDRAGVTAGSDFYLGELTFGNVADLYLSNAILASVLGPDQPSTSLEFEAGTGDYGERFDHVEAPEATVLKTLITIAQGNRMINYYLFAGGRNPQLETASETEDGLGRIAFTGERHGFAAPVSPEGTTGAHYDALQAMITELRRYAPVLAAGVQAFDELVFGFVADHYLTEYAHPDSGARAAQVKELERFRGQGLGDGLGRALVLGGWSFPAVDLQALAEPESAWARGSAGDREPDPAHDHHETDRQEELAGKVVAVATGPTLAAPVQQLLADHLGSGGRLLLVGQVPDQDHEGTRCTILADALGLLPADDPRSAVRSERVDAESAYWPSVGSPTQPLAADVRVSFVQLLTATGEIQVKPLLVERGTDRPAAVAIESPAGRAVVLSCDLPAGRQDLWRLLFDRLGLSPRVRTDADRRGLITIPVVSAEQSLLLVVNVAPYPIRSMISFDGVMVSPDHQFSSRGWALLPVPAGS